MLIDSFGRRIDYLRVSITDLCNFRCTYCVPPEGTAFIPAQRRLTREEITRFVGIAAGLGVRRVRLTGGEPLLREDVVEIVQSIKRLGVIEDLSITTNGSRLQNFLKPLKNAGLDRINISLDSLDAGRFESITLSGAYREVMDSVRMALAEGFPIKLNMVVMQGLTADEIIRFVGLAVEHDLEARFLEFMPLCGSAWGPEKVIPIQRIRQIVLEHFNLEADDEPRGDRVAQTFKICGGKGRVGFIGSLTESFCGDCSRMRLTADGKIRPCLFSEKEVSAGELLRNHAPDEAIAEAICLAVSIKPAGNLFHEAPFGSSMDGHLDFAVQKNPLIRMIGG